VPGPTVTIQSEAITFETLTTGGWKAIFDGPDGRIVAYGTSQEDVRTALELMIGTYERGRGPDGKGG
jgi:hypothetical protein